MEMKDKRNCPHFGICGGCSYLDKDYEDVLKIKEERVKSLIDAALENDDKTNIVPGYEWEGIKPSPAIYGYRNKMEFSFGDEVKAFMISLMRTDA